MKISWLWLKEFVDFDLSPAETAKLLRSLGFDTASVQAVGAGVSGVVTAKVEAREKHPNADKLSLCRVNDGETVFKVVCGAPNVAAGQTVPLARLGARLPGGVEIKAAKIRGEESQGMLCSRRELDLGEDHAGILVLPEDTPLGREVNEVLMLGDAVLDVEVMPNRPDMLSHWGVARELAAALKKPLKLPESDVPSAPKASLAAVKDPELCDRYLGRAFEGVKPGPAPLKARLRLERCGFRSISNLVDVTNTVMLELGHPLHVFDLDLLAGGRVNVRRGAAGEKLACLDGVERPVDGLPVIADDAKPQAAAGVIGGAASGVTEKTTRVLLESAHFPPSLVRASRRRLNVATESSYRFERGTDRDMAALASRRAARLILSWAGGRMTGEDDVSAAPPAPRPVEVDPARVESLLGFPVSPADVQDVMQRLGFSVQKKGSVLLLAPPAHRHDVKETADVAEEVGRLTGLDRVPERLRAASQELEPPSAERRLLVRGREFLAGRGFLEAKNAGLVSSQGFAGWEGRDGLKPVALDNPLSASADLLAPALLPLLLGNAQLNRRRGAADVRLFEAARAFLDEGGALRERLSLAFVAEGGVHGGHWKFKPRALEFWDLKSWVKELSLLWRLPGVAFGGEGVPSFLHPAQGQSVRAGGKPAGFFGRLHPRTAESLDLSADTFVCELDLTALSAVTPLEARHGGLAQHPALIRDFSLTFPVSAAWKDVALWVAREVEHVEDVELFDVYKGKAGVPSEGKRSLAFRVTFRHPERTLTDAEGAGMQEKLMKGLQAVFQAAPRQ